MTGIKWFKTRKEAKECAAGFKGWTHPARVEQRQFWQCGEGCDVQLVTLYAVRTGARYLREDGLVE